LTEVKELLSKLGLGLGQLEPLGAPPPVAPAPTPVEVPPGREPMLSKPVSQLELSVRSRKCLQRLNITTVGDLLQRSEQDLLAIRNFGQTSLDEIKGRLGELGLSLAGSSD
jgi:DNA-directed RNA polymerase subunit alpha